MKGLTILFLFSIILSCSNQTKETATQAAIVKPINEVESDEEKNSVDTSVTHVSQKEKTIQGETTLSTDSSKFQFAYKSFFLTSDYDLSNCNALARCDCCISEIYFKNEVVFIYSTDCAGTTSYTKGTYSFNDLTLTLKHDSLLVVNKQPFGDNEDKSKFGISQERRYIKPFSYMIETCGDQVLLHSKVSNDNEYGTEEFQRNSLLYIVNDTGSEITQKLELN